MKQFLLGLILVSSSAMADNIIITDIAVKEGDQVIVFVDDIGRYVTVATENAVKVVFDADDVLPGKHQVIVRVRDGKLEVKETKKEINVK